MFTYYPLLTCSQWSDRVRLQLATYKKRSRILMMREPEYEYWRLLKVSTILHISWTLSTFIPSIRIIQVSSRYCIQLEVWGICTKTSPHPDICVWLLETLANYKLINCLSLFKLNIQKDIQTG